MRRSCARATLAAFFVWWELLGAQPLMPDYLGGGSLEDQGGEVQDYLGRTVQTAFKSQPALPVGGGAPGASAAPPSVAGAGTVVGGGAATPSGGRAGAERSSTLAQIAQALGLAGKAGEVARKAGQPAPPSSEFGDVLTRSGITAEEFDTLLKNLPPGWTEGQDIPGLDELKFAPPPEIPDTGAGPGATGTIGAADVAGLVGSGLGLAGGLSGNRDVSMAGSTASAAANLGSLAAYGAGAAGAGAGAAGAIPALLFSGLQMEHDMSDAARIKADIANVKNVLGAKVPSAMSRLGKTLNDISSLDPASATTEQLLGAQQQLQAARTEFNQVDAAFKGTLLVGNKPVQTGLTLDMVKPQLDALNESQLRIQDALESRGLKSEAIPGYQSPMDWLNFVAPDFYNSVRGIDANALKNFERDPAYYGLDPNDPTLAMARELGAIQPGQTEAGLRGYVAGHQPAETSPALQRALRAAFGDQGSYAEAAGHVDAP